MKHYKVKTAAALAAIALVGTVLASGQSAYDAAVPDGFFWYRDHPAQKPKPKEKQEKTASPAPVTQQPVEEKPRPGSAEWFRRTEKELLDRMTGEPDEKTVFAYQTLNRLRMDRADQVARIWESNNQKYPFLSEEVRMPFSARARQQALWEIGQAKDKIMADISSKAGLWLFFDSKCSFCLSQYRTVSALREKFPNMAVRYISTDGGIISGMDRRLVRNDTGGERARSLGIQLTPAVVMVVPPDKMGLIAHGAVSLDELEEKIVTAAIDMKVVDPKLAQTAKMNERGMIDRNDWEAAGITGEESPDELADKIYNIIGRKMGQAK